MSSAIPECPITKAPLEDPVTDPDGITYERKAITAWVQQHGTSPMTRKPLTLADLVPNRALKDLITEIKANGSIIKTSELIAVKAVDVGPAITEADVEFCHWSINETQKAYTIYTPDLQRMFPVHICCVLDISGSMSGLATLKNASGVSESDGLNILDLVKHATRTIIESLGDNDLLSIISFSEDAWVELEPTLMNKAGKIQAGLALDKLQTISSTNLVAGLTKSIEVSATVDKKFQGSVFLLTDGQPDNAQLDYKTMMRNLLKDNPINGTFHTFGFGYNLNSLLLEDIAIAGDGSFGFIPDAGMVGTVFINALVNVRMGFCTNAEIRFEFEQIPAVSNGQHNPQSHKEDDGAQSGEQAADSTDAQTPNNSNQKRKERKRQANLDKLFGVLGSFRRQWTENVLTVYLGTLRFGQSQTIVVTQSDPLLKLKNVSLKFTNSDANECTLSPPIPDSESRHDQMDDFDRVYHLLRATTSTVLYNVVKANYDCIKIEYQNSPDKLWTAAFLKETGRAFADAKQLSTTDQSTDDIDAILTDLEGQACIALSREDYFTKWGRHYLLSLCNAHGRQWCNNFKDPGVQCYANGSLFKELQPSLQAMFLKLPPPVPSRPLSEYDGHHGAPVSMSRYMNQGGVCFHPDSRVLLMDHKSIAISRLKPGMRVYGGQRVRCIVETRLSSDQPTTFVQLSHDLLVTLYHPVRHPNINDGRWLFPVDTGRPIVHLHTTAVFNLVLDEADYTHQRQQQNCIQSSMSSQWQCCTLGHRYNDNACIQHAYFGSMRRVISDLQNVSPDGWLRGHIVLHPDQIIRRPNFSCESNDGSDAQAPIIDGLVVRGGACVSC